MSYSVSMTKEEIEEAEQDILHNYKYIAYTPLFDLEYGHKDVMILVNSKTHATVFQSKDCDQYLSFINRINKNRTIFYDRIPYSKGFIIRAEQRKEDNV